MRSFLFEKRSSAKPISAEDEESFQGLISGAISQDRELSVFKIHASFAVLHTVIAALWISSFWTFGPLCSTTPSILKPFEFSPAAGAIEYETVVFDISGGGTRDNPITPYEGPPNPEKDMRWWELSNVGMMALTPEMNATLRTPTQPASKTDSTPLIQLDVFHQLHCLNAIRQILYGTNKWFDPEERQDQIHVDHCLDYLRQVIMCHSDVTPITHSPRPEPYHHGLSPWRPNFAVQHTCRNFWKIHEWAQQYNTSGFVIESWPGLDPVAELREKPLKDAGS